MQPPPLAALVIRRTLRVPLPAATDAGASGPDASATARRLDAALLTAGFTLSGELLARLSALPPVTAADLAATVLAAVRELVGDHVRHNAYFKNFPRGVPDTLEFWIERIREALGDPATAGAVTASLSIGVLNLLDLPRYGEYQHTYAELAAAHDDLVASAADRLTVLHAGDTLDDEAGALYLRLAGSPVPLGDDDRAALAALADVCLDAPQPERIPVRENRALVNRTRLAAGRPLLADTVTDVLRLACALSGGDETLEAATRFRSFRRPERRVMLAALDAVVAASPAKLADVGRFAERWKRLGERLHPHEYPAWPHAAEVFAVARGERRAPSMAGRAQRALDEGDVPGAIAVLRTAPGALFRALDHLARFSRDPRVHAGLLDAVRETAPSVSGRVLLGLREHLLNRDGGTGRRVFVNRRGRAWPAPDERAPLDPALSASLRTVLDDEIAARLPKPSAVTVDPRVRDLALPLSEKTRPGGFGILPRGSVSPVDGSLLRFFVYWRQRERRTDYDLSAAFLDARFGFLGHVSFTELKRFGAVHSGDVTSAKEGASEFIEIDLAALDPAVRHIVPQVDVYTGEGFPEAAEAFFGYMEREPGARGMPFEPRTVRVKSDLARASRVAFPLAFVRADDDTWTARWLHLHLAGSSFGNTVEGAVDTVAQLVANMLARDCLRVGQLLDLVRPGGDAPLYVGMARPENVPEGTRVVTPENLTDLIPD